MRTYRLIDKNIRMYVMDEEIIPYLKDSPDLLEIYEEIKDVEAIAVVPLVAMEDDLKCVFNLDIIVKQQEPSKYGFYEYYFTGDIVNKKTNLYLLLETLTTTTQIDLEQLIDTISRQLEAHTITMNYQLSIIKGKAKKIFVVKSDKQSALN